MIKKKPVKRLVAMLLTFVMLLTMVPVGVYYTVFAASTDYKTVSAGDATIYMYGVSSVEDSVVDNGKYVIEYAGGDELALGLYVDGSKITVSDSDPEIEFDSYKISLSKSWVDSQSKWIAVKCSSTSSIPSTMPLPDIDGITITPYIGSYDEETHDAVKVEGTKPKDVITYSTDGIDYDAIMPTITNVGSQDVYVKVTRSEHNEYVSEKVTASVSKGTIDWINVTAFNQAYNPADTSAKPAVTISGEIDSKPVVVKYSVDDGASYEDVVPTIEFPGSKTIKVKITRENYNDYETTVTAQMASATIEGIQVSPNAGVIYDGKEHPIVLENGISGLQDGDEVLYSTDGTNYTSDKPKYIDAGDYYFFIKVKRQYHEDYLSFPSKFKFTISQAEIKGVSATGYSGKYDLLPHKAITSVNGTKDGDKITYSSNNEESSYSTTCPKVTFSWDSGTYYVKVQRSKNYKDLVIPVTVTINKKEQAITFDEIATQTYKDRDNNTFTVSASSNAESDNNHNSHIEYSIVGDKTTADATVDKNTGVVKYTSVGTITIKASTNESKNIKTSYLDSSNEYSVIVEYVTTPNNYKVTNEQYNYNGYKWYSCDEGTDGFVITAPEGWVVIKDSNAQGQLDWTDKVEEFEENVYSDYKVAFKNTATNEITDLVSIPNFIIDKTNPEVSSFKFEAENTSLLAKAINALSFGTFCKEKVKITVNCTDHENKDTSSKINIIKLYEYAIDGITEVKEIAADSIDTENGYAVFYIEPYYEGTIRAEVIDNVNRTSGRILAHQKNSNIGTDESGYMMIENEDPIVSKIIKDEPLNDSVRKEIVDGKTIYSGDIKFSFSAQDIDSGLYSVDVKINDESYVKGDDEYPKYFISGKSQDRENHDFVISTDNLDAKYLRDDGSFKIDVTVIDNAGNYVADRTVTVYKDTTSATIKGYRFSLDNFIDVLGNADLYKVVEVTDYGFYFKKDVVVTITAEDLKADNEIASGVKTISYVAVDIDGNSYEENNVPVNDKNEVSFTISKDFKGQIYAYATDMVGNNTNNSNLPSSEKYDISAIVAEGKFKGYVHPNGIIVETADKHKENSKIEFSSVPTAQGTQNNTSNYSYQGEAQKDATMDFDTSKNVPLYNNDISFGVKVTDTYSGIREVSYTIIEGKESTTKTVAVDNEGKISGADEGWTVTKTDSNLATEMANTIAVSGNYNDMVLLIELTDRAGNKSYDYYVFGIDKTAPSITVTYDNNSSDTQSGTGDYFKANRTATILVQERNFNTENVKFTLKNAEGKAPQIVDKGLVTKDTEGNGDGNVYKYVIPYTADGVYTFDVNYTDRATNKASVDYKDSVAPKAFTLDKTLPIISVSYDNNDAQNEKYFKAYRTATITVVEHNFDVNRVTITQTSALSGNAIANPSVSWVNSGDTHTATIHYNADGDYTFDITMTDKADNKETSVNYGSSVAAKDFTVDTTYSDLVKVDGIADKGVLGLANGEINEDAKINITINDVNLDNYNIKLTRSRVLVTGESDGKLDASQDNVVDNPETQCAEDNVDVTSKFVSNASGTENATAVISIPKKDDEGVKNDGLYTLTIEAKDKAGNAYDTNASIITFSVNRFGSVFTFSKDLYDLINKNDGYTKSVSSTNLTVYEYNATSVNSESVEVISNNDSKTLIANADYTVGKDTKQTDTSWSKYTYTVRPDNFKNDGVYTLRISSKDDASITSQTVDYDVCSATFRVDSTPADIISVNYSTDVNKIAGHDGGSAKADNLTVNFSVEDLIRLETVEVFVNDMENPVKTYVYGKDFDDANSFDGGSFELSNDTQEQSFKIVATDKAGNIIDTSEGDSNGNKFEPGYVFFDHITVTTNQVVIWAKSPVFWVVIGGVVAAAVGLTIFAVVKKRKKNDE